MQQKTPTGFAESLSGLIERITFFNDDTGFGVLKVKAKGHRDLVPVVGSLPSANAGEWVTAEGRWIQDREFGLQFRAEMLTSTAPTTKEDIEKYLGSVKRAAIDDPDLKPLWQSKRSSAAVRPVPIGPPWTSPSLTAFPTAAGGPQRAEATPPEASASPVPEGRA